MIEGKSDDRLIRQGRIVLFLMGLLCVAFSTRPRPCFAQFASEPQADSPAEFDAYLRVLSKRTPQEVISAAKEFEQGWPHSELRGQVFEMELEAYWSLDDAQDALKAGESALTVDSDNLSVLASVAYILADTTTDPQHLVRAEHYARRELSVSESFRVPKWIAPEKWDRTRRKLGSKAHDALGLIMYKQGDIESAILEFNKAVKLAPSPDPAEYYRLGMLYKAAGNKRQAIRELRHAANSKELAIRKLARRELEVLQQ